MYAMQKIQEKQRSKLHSPEEAIVNSFEMLLYENLVASISFNQELKISYIEVYIYIYHKYISIYIHITYIQ